MNREELLNHLEKESKVLELEPVREAFYTIDRADFVTEDYVSEAYEDYAVPIGFDQTISQPTTVAFMLELLGAEKGDQVLDIGSGSGWTTALLAHIVGKEGYVWGIEILPELVERGGDNIAKYSFPNAEIIQAVENEIGLPQDFQYDRILVSATAEVILEELVAQLKVGGTMVIPVGESILQVIKISEDGGESEENEEGESLEDVGKAEIEINEFPGFAFVPLVY